MNDMHSLPENAADAKLAREPRCIICGHVAPEGEGLDERGACSDCWGEAVPVYPVEQAS